MSEIKNPNKKEKCFYSIVNRFLENKADEYNCRADQLILEKKYGDIFLIKETGEYSKDYETLESIDVNKLSRV